MSSFSSSSATVGYSGHSSSDKSAFLSSAQQASRMVHGGDIWTHIATYLSPREIFILNQVSKAAGAATAPVWKILRDSEQIRLLTQCNRLDFDSDKALVASAWAGHVSGQGTLFITGNFIEPQQSAVVEIEPSSCRASVISANDRLGVGSLGASSQAIDENGSRLLLGGWNAITRKCSDVIYSLNRPSRKLGNSIALVESGRMPMPLCYHSSITLADGRILITGGGSSPYQGSAVYEDCYMSHPSDNNHTSDSESGFITESTMPSSDEENDDSVWEDCDAGDLRWKKVAPMAIRRCGHVSVVLRDNSVVSLGGYSGGESYLSSAELMDATTGEWITLPAMSTYRTAPAAFVGEQGSIYVAGGSTNGTIGLKSCERLDPREPIGWTMMASMNERRGYGGFCVGPSNRLFVSGGLHNNILSGTMEFFDPRMNLWQLADVVAARNTYIIPSGNKMLRRSGHQMIYLWES